MAIPTDSESGAQTGPALWEWLLKQEVPGPVVLEVHEPIRGHPTLVHETYGGAEIPAFRTSFVQALRARAVGQAVFRITANAFVIVAVEPSPLRWNHRYREVEVAVAVRRLQVTEVMAGSGG